MYVNPLSFYAPTYPSCRPAGAQPAPETPQDEPALLPYLNTPASLFFQAAEADQPSSQPYIPENRNADTFVSDQQRKKDEQKGKIANLNEALEYLGTIKPKDLYTNYLKINRTKTWQSERGESRILLWIFSRNTGHPEAASLLSNAITDLRAGGSVDDWSGWRYNYWLPQLSMILSNELDDPALRGVLEELLPSLKKNPNWHNQDMRIKEMAALEEIYNKFLTREVNGQRKPIDRLTLFVGENLYRRALLAKSLGDDENYQKLLDQAKAYISILATLVTLDNVQDLNQNPQFEEQKKYIPALTLHVREVLPSHFAQANLLMANILMREAENLTQPSEILSKLQEAAKYLNNTSPLEGISLLEARRVLAENLIQQAYMKKNLNEEYLSIFGNALSHLNYILQWEKDYQAKIGASGLRPRWLVNITTSAKLSRIKLFQVLVGEINRRPDPAVLGLLSQAGLLTPEDKATLEQGASKTQVLQIQGRILKKLAAELDEIQKVTYPYQGTDPVKVVRNEEEMYLKLSLAENLARQGFIALDLGQPDNLSLFDAAKTLLSQVINSCRYEVDTLNSGKLRREILSQAYQTYGDILTALKKFKEATQQYQLALKENKSNFYARISLADIYNWLGKYEKAEEEYQSVLKNAPANSLAAAAAKLGLLEITMRKKGDYHQIEDQETFELLSQIFEKEFFSTLRPRAIKLLLEAFKSKKSWHGGIILIANAFLKTSFNAEANFPNLTNLLKLVSAEDLDESFKAELSLELCQVLIWDKRFDEAQNLLNSIESTYAQTFAGNKGLNARLNLVKATLAVRKNARDKKHEYVPEVFSAAKAVFENASDDPYLMQEAIMLMIEELAGEKKFEEIVKLADYFLDDASTSDSNLSDLLHLENIPLNLTRADLQRSFADLGIEYKFKGLTFKLRIAKIDALIWGEQYEAALEESRKLTPEHPEETIQLWLRLGDIYQYLRGVDNLEEAKQYYLKILSLAKTLPESDIAKEALGRAYFGLAKIYQENQEQNKAITYIKKMLSPNFEGFVDDDTRQEAKKLLAALVDPLASVSSSASVFSASSADSAWSEFQENLILEFLLLRNPRLSLTLRNQTDHNRNLVRNTPYLGIKVKAFDWLTLALEHQLYFPKASFGKGDFKYFRNPDLSARVSLHSKYADAQLSCDFNYQESQLNTQYFNVFLRPLRLLNDYVRWDLLHHLAALEIGAEVSHYHFALASKATLPERWSLTLPSARYYLDLAEVFNGLAYDYLKLSLFAGLVINFIPDPKEREDLRLSYYNGWKFGFGLTWDPGPVIVSLSSEWQQDRFFHQWLISLNINLAPLFLRIFGN